MKAKGSAFTNCPDESDQDSRMYRLPHFSHIIYLLAVAIVSTSICRDVKPQNESRLPDYNIYHNLSRIQSHLRAVASRHPDYMRVDWTYVSRLRAPQMLLRINNFTDFPTDVEPFPNGVRLRVLLSYGEHPREFLPIESLFHLLDVISRGLTAHRRGAMDHFTQLLLSRVDLFIVVVLNPDGRRLVEDTLNYCWRGTSTGVDLNRNFDWSYGRTGSSANTQDEEYRGPRPFSGSQFPPLQYRRAICTNLVTEKM